MMTQAEEAAGDEVGVAVGNSIVSSSNCYLL